MTTPPYRMIAVDPGPDVMGYAEFVYQKRGQHEGARLVRAHIIPVADFLVQLSLDVLMSRYHVFVYERFVLRPDLAQELSGQDMLTSETIGLLLSPIRLQNRHAKLHRDAKQAGKAMSCDPNPNCPPRRVKIVGQMADVQRPTSGILKQRGIQTRGPKPHGLSAELHGWHYLLNHEEKP